MAFTSPHRQTSILAGLIAFGILAIALGAGNLKRLIGPVRIVPGTNVPSIPRTREEFEQQQRAALASLDTDRDGIDDLTELEWTKSSPFLADSDSDGKSDKEEVDAGEDPNCPKGKVCASGPSSVQPSGTTPARASDGPSSLLGALELFNPSTPAQPVGAATPTDTARSDSAELRRSLERFGVSRRVLDALSDEQLVASYGTMLRVVGQTPSGAPSPASDVLRGAFTNALGGRTSGSPNFLGQALPTTPASVRQFLLQGGLPKGQLDQLDDTTIMQIWEQVIAKMNVRVPAVPVTNP